MKVSSERKGMEKELGNVESDIQNASEVVDEIRSGMQSDKLSCPVLRAMWTYVMFEWEYNFSENKDVFCRESILSNLRGNLTKRMNRMATMENVEYPIPYFWKN